MTQADDSHFQLESYHFDVPPALIARYPLPERTESRLMVLKRDADQPTHEQFPHVLELLQPGDVLVVNNTKVIPARLHAEKATTGGRVEVLLGREAEDGSYIALVQPARRLKPGTRLIFSQPDAVSIDPLYATVEERVMDEPGAFRIRFEGDPIAFAEQYGEIPLPPYLDRDAEQTDQSRYQTVFASDAKKGASAAPTAGLHFSQNLLDELDQRGVIRAEVTLQVGPGTFFPIRDSDIRDHKMHTEPWEISSENAKRLSTAFTEGRRIIAVGTTAMRVLESAFDDDSPIPFHGGRGLTNLFIYPGYRFKAVNALVTNFHLPDSSLILLVSAFVGRERLIRAYQEAIDMKYRFFSYGDCCFFERN